MASPYWGNLNPPVVAAPRRSNSLRQSEMDRRSSLEQPVQSLSQAQLSRPNRLSTQSYAPTDSTQSPFASPISSNFRGHGLAPRPPSFPYDAQEIYNNEYLERRRRRQSREQDPYYPDNDVSIPPPAAPDVPRAPPPVSYRQTYNNSQPATAYQPPVRTRSGRYSDGPIEAKTPSQSNHHRSEPSARSYRSELDRRPSDAETIPNRPRNDSIGREDGLDIRTFRRASVDARRGRPEVRKVAGPSRPRQGSATDVDAQRRREWAPDRSPLQRLELTLDSITKEEKRARVEEVELLAREAKAGRGGQNSVHFRNKSIASAQPAQPEPQTLAEAGLVRNLSTKQKEELQRSRTVEKTRPAPPNQLGKGFEYQPSNQIASTSQEAAQPRIQTTEPVDERTSIPQRGRSFRERTAVPAAAAATVAVVGGNLGRSNSNKLRKEPPGDPWYTKRQDAERKAQEIAQRQSMEDTKAVPAGSWGATAPGLVDARSVTTGDTGRQTSKRHSTSHPLDIPDLYSDDEDIPAPVRRNSSKKVEQLMGGGIGEETSMNLRMPQQGVSQQMRPDLASKYPVNTGLPHLNTDLRMESAIHPATTGIQATNRDLPVTEGLQENRRSQYLPGDGVYASSNRLDEWKGAGVATLTGGLLDLSTKPVESDKDKAWWEARQNGRRRSSTGKQRAIDNYDGEDDDSGIVFSPSSNLTLNDENYVPVIGTDKWMVALDSVAPRTRQYIGYQGTSESQSKVRRRNRSWRKEPPDPSSAGTTGDAEQISNSRFPTLFSYAPDCPNKSDHNILHPFHICHKQPKPEITRLTRSMRSIRIRTPAVPTSFKPPLFLRCGPLLRYCGLRHEEVPVRSGRTSTARQRIIWRGSVMIVTLDSKSSYEQVPLLRLFSQPVKLLPPPPAQVDGGADVAPEYVDPIAGLPKIGRDGRTLYVRPVEDLAEEKDISREESNDGIFESERTASTPLGGFDGPSGEKLGKVSEVPGIRLHAERGVTFWRFNIEVELTESQQRIAYRINRGPATGFWVPGRRQSMNIMFHSCNGFSISVNSDLFSGPDPMWRDVLNTHQTQPFHVMIGGGDQIYNDLVMKETVVFQEWLAIKDPLQKHNAPFTREMQDELENFYLQRYCMWFSQGLFGLANAQIPMVNIYDDHDIIDGYGSYPDHFMDSPVFSGLGSIAFKYYMLFQHQSVIDEGEETEPTWLLGHHPGPYIKELSRSVFMSLGHGVAFLGLDCRTERSREDIVSQETMDKVLNRCQQEIVKGETKHLVVLLGVPIAYPRLVWLENIMTSRLWEPVKAVGRANIFNRRGSRTGFVNKFDGGVEILDDLDDHWTAKIHKNERNDLVNDLQDLAAEKSVRITILSGDVHLAAIGQFYSNPKLGIPKDRDHRYMPNIVSSAIVNTPPPEVMTDILNKRNKIHHLDDFTDEDMIPIFTHDVNGAKRNNRHLLPRRNWCSIRQYNPELSPPPTPDNERSLSPSPPPPVGLLRRLSSTRGPSFRSDAARPPPSGGLMRRFSLSGRRASVDTERPNMRTEAPEIRPRAMSLSRREFLPGGLFRRGSKRQPDDGGINGTWGADSDDDPTPYSKDINQPRLRGGAGDESFFRTQTVGGPRRKRITRNDVRDQYYDDEYPPPPAPLLSQQSEALPRPMQQADPRPRLFHRTPTGMSEKQWKHIGEHEINLEGGLDICLNVEISQRDPAGTTVPYRLLVPALWYEDEDERADQHIIEKKPTGLIRLLSFGRAQGPRPRVAIESGPV